MTEKIMIPLPEGTQNQENAVEEHFCKPFEQADKHEMSIADTGDLLLLASSKNTFSNWPLLEKEKPFLYKVIEQRVQACFTFKITDCRLIMWLCMISKSPGTAVMYLAYLQYWCKKNNVKEIDIDIFCEKVLPSGYPSEEDLQEIWDAQKVIRTKTKGDIFPGSDNLLDYQQAYKSIQF